MKLQDENKQTKEIDKENENGTDKSRLCEAFFFISHTF